MSRVYYADCSLHAVAEPRFILWSNMESLLIVLADWGVKYGDFEDGVDYAIDVQLPSYESYDEVVQICEDCATVENMLASTDLDLRQLTWI